LRVVGAVDRTGFVFDADGLTPARVAELAKLKQQGRSFAQAPKGHKGAPAEAVHYFAKHALSRPILVDVTAHDTTAVLIAAANDGMDIVLANKRPMSSKTADHNALRAAVSKGGRQLRFEATVGAGLPILDTYRKLAESGDKVLRIEGCISGTLGYLLTAVGQGKKFSEAVSEAMAKGYTEPDPRDDLSGADVGRKALILGRLLGFAGEPEDVVVESLVPVEAKKLSKEAFVAKLPAWDADWEKRVEAARAQGSVLRYVATVTAKKISVGLIKVPRGTPFASLEGTDNQIAFTTTRYRSPLVITGAGAGLEVTAGGVLNDLLDLVGV
jgi:aspartokinase/homoserine dehydrogenase 1